MKREDFSITTRRPERRRASKPRWASKSEKERKKSHGVAAKKTATMNACLDKPGSGHPVEFLDTKKAKSYIQYLKEECGIYRSVSTGLNPTVRNLIVVDLDDYVPRERLVSDIERKLGIRPSYHRLNLANGHSQVGWFVTEVEYGTYNWNSEAVSATQSGVAYVRVGKTLAKEFGGDVRFTHWHCQNPFYEGPRTSEGIRKDFDVKVYSESEVEWETLAERALKLPSTKETESARNVVRTSMRKTNGTPERRRYKPGDGIRILLDYSHCGNSRHFYILQATNEAIINRMAETGREVEKTEEEARDIAAEVFGTWPKSYDKAHPYTMDDCLADVRSALFSFKPSPKKNVRGWTDADRAISAAKRGCKQLVKVEGCVRAVENGMKRTEARRKFGVTSNAWKKFRLLTSGQVRDLFLEKVSGLVEWGSARDLAFASMVKSLNKFTHGNDVHYSDIFDPSSEILSLFKAKYEKSAEAWEIALRDRAERFRKLLKPLRKAA